tara:strand:+ start:307 stop:1116 length:810 start_codon:yes stop_codon:yes gene_type:complete
MKLTHNKKRNTAFIYEVLIKTLSVASIKNDEATKSRVIKTLKEFFNKSTDLKKELDIYRSLEAVGDHTKDIAEKIVAEAKRQFNSLDRKQIFNTQTRLISEINKTFGKDSWDIFVKNYKSIATINQVLNQNLNPKAQIMLENKLYQQNKTEEVKPLPQIDNLTVQKFVERFNSEYTEKLNEHQKELLSNYISSYQDNGLTFKMFLYEEIDRLKCILQENADSSDDDVSQKLNKVINKINDYGQQPISGELLSEVLTIQSLTQELQSNGN